MRMDEHHPVSEPLVEAFPQFVVAAVADALADGVRGGRRSRDFPAAAVIVRRKENRGAAVEIKILP